MIKTELAILPYRTRNWHNFILTPYATCFCFGFRIFISFCCCCFLWLLWRINWRKAQNLIIWKINFHKLWTLKPIHFWRVRNWVKKIINNVTFLCVAYMRTQFIHFRVVYPCNDFIRKSVDLFCILAVLAAHKQRISL